MLILGASVVVELLGVEVVAVAVVVVDVEVVVVVDVVDVVVIVVVDVEGVEGFGGVVLAFLGLQVGYIFGREIGARTGGRL